MGNSDILNNFIKIAEEQGLIPLDAPDKAKKKLEKNPRMDSLSADDLKKLYNVKPEQAKGNKYQRNIIEDAHPTSVIIGPSYDKLNGLVENNNERQDILLHILNKTPNGQLTNHKYAEKNLILSLVRIANDLDNHNQDQLRILADTCLIQVSNCQPLKKEGIAFLAAGLIAVPVLLGSFYLQQHLSFINEGFEKNHQKLLSELDDLLQASASWGVGYAYKSDFLRMVQDFKNKLTEFYSLFEKVEPIISELEKPKTAQELLEISKHPQTDTVVKAYGELKTAANNMLPYLMMIEKNFSSENYKIKQIEDKGFLSSLVDKMQVLHGGKGLISDDFDDVVRALTPYKKSIFDLVDVLKKAESIEKSAQQQIQDAEMESKTFDQTKSEESETTKLPDQNIKPPTDMDVEIENLDKDLSSGGIF